MEISETFDVQHMYLINEEDTRNKFCHSLIDVFIHHLIDFFSKFVCNFCFLWFHQLSHHGKNILTALRSSVCNVEIMQGDILNNFLFLVHVTFWKWNVLLSLKVKL